MGKVELSLYKENLIRTIKTSCAIKIFFCALSLPLWGEMTIEEDTLQQFVERREYALQRQKELQKRIRLFHEEKQRFSESDVSKQQARRMVNAAKDVLEIITEQHLQYLFSSDYMEELLLFSSIAGKNRPTRP